MIPASGTVDAVYEFKRGERTHYLRRRIEAWADNGSPLVAGPRDLILASDLGRYELETSDGAVGFLPGGGFIAKYGDGSTRPVAGWSLSRSGYGVALLCDDGGLEPDETPGRVEIIHRHDTEPTEPTELEAAS